MNGARTQDLHDFIAYGDLTIRNRSKGPAPKGVFLTILNARAESAGRETVAVDAGIPPVGVPHAGPGMARSPAPQGGEESRIGSSTPTSWYPPS